MIYYLIVPGLGGSRIYCNCCSSRAPKKIYPVLGSLSKHFFDKNCVSSVKPLKTVCAISIYKKLTLRLGKEKCEYFPYDWRWQTPLSVAKKLAEYINARKGKQLSLIGHSNGGFIIRILLEYLKFQRDKIDRVYICGTPFFGSINELVYKNEDNLYEKLKNSKISISIKPLLLSRKDIDRIFIHCRESLIYFIPTYIFKKKTNSELAIELDLNETDIMVARAVHLQLANFDIKSYVFYFNISRQDYVTTAMNDKNFYYIVPAATDLIKKPGNNFIVSMAIRSDSLVIPTAEFPRNSIILYDTYPLSHSLIMNSTFLSKIITDTLTYSYQNC